jgi:hypothetical protein
MAPNIDGRDPILKQYHCHLTPESRISESCGQETPRTGAWHCGTAALVAPQGLALTSSSGLYSRPSHHDLFRLRLRCLTQTSWEDLPRFASA